MPSEKPFSLRMKDSGNDLITPGAPGAVESVSIPGQVPAHRPGIDAGVSQAMSRRGRSFCGAGGMSIRTVIG